MAAFMLPKEIQILVAETVCPAKLKYLLCGPLCKMFAGLVLGDPGLWTSDT